MTRARLPALVLAIAGGVLALWLMFSLGGGAPRPAPAGIPDPGAFTGWMLPVLSAVSVLLAIVVAAAVMVPVLTLHQRNGMLTGPGAASVRSIGFLAPTWLLTIVLQVVFTASDQWGAPVDDLQGGQLWRTLTATNYGKAYITQFGIVLVLAIFIWRARTAKGAGWLLALTLLATVPPAMNGHSAGSGSHDAAIVALVVHVLAITVWLAGLVALWWFLAARPDERVVAAHRFSMVAGWAFGVTVVSGLVSAHVRLAGPSELFSTGYGRGALAKIIIVLLVGAVAIRTRRLAVARLQGGSGLSGMIALTGIEVVLLTAAVGVGAALGRTPPPIGEIYTSFAERLIGRPMPPEPGVADLLWSFVPSGVGFVVVGFGAVGYIVGLISLRRHGQSWSVMRTISWFFALVIIGWATFGGLGLYGMVVFSWHMASHTILGMIAPIFLAIGDPIGLALRALPGTDEDGGRGPRQWLSWVLHSRFVRVITHPVFASVMFVGSLYAVYYTGLFEVMMRNHLGHALMQVHFLLSGMVFFELVVGRAPIPGRVDYVGRLLMMLVVTPFHSFFAIGLMMSHTPVGEAFYRALDRGYATDLLRDQYVGGSLTWAVGDIPMLVVAIVVVLQWWSSEERAARRHDRQADRDHDAELTAYNEMLARLSQTPER